MIYQSAISSLRGRLKNEKLSFHRPEVNKEFKVLCNFKNSFELIGRRNLFLKDPVYLVEIFKYFFHFAILQRLIRDMTLYLKIKVVFSNKFFTSRKMVGKF